MLTLYTSKPLKICDDCQECLKAQLYTLPIHITSFVLQQSSYTNPGNPRALVFNAWYSVGLPCIM